MRGSEQGKLRRVKAIEFHGTHLEFVDEPVPTEIINEVVKLTGVDSQCVIVIEAIHFDVPQIQLIVGENSERIRLRSWQC